MKTKLSWRDIASRIDAALLKAMSSKSDLLKLTKEAAQLGYRSVCVPPYLVEPAAKSLDNTGVRVGTVIGFPFGFNTTSTKMHETRTASQMGAKEVDYVVGIGEYMSDGVKFVELEASALLAAAKDCGIDVVKSIIEVGYVSRDQLKEVCLACSSSGVDYLKTATGYGPRPTTVEDVRFMVEAVSGRTPVKAAGGIRDLHDALSMFEAGAELIGTSNPRKIIDEARTAES